MRRKQKPTS